MPRGMKAAKPAGSALAELARLQTERASLIEKEQQARAEAAKELGLGLLAALPNDSLDVAQLDQLVTAVKSIGVGEAVRRLQVA